VCDQVRWLEPEEQNQRLRQAAQENLARMRRLAQRLIAVLEEEDPQNLYVTVDALSLATVHMCGLRGLRRYLELAEERAKYFDKEETSGLGDRVLNS